MKALWQKLAARYAGLAARERRWIFIGAVLAVGMLAYVTMLEPSWTRRSLAARDIVQADAQLAALQAQLAALRASRRDPDEATRAQLAQVKEETRGVEQQFSALQSALVAPQEMKGLVEQLIRRHGGLQLRSLRTLPVISVSDMVTPASGAATKPEAARAEAGQDAWLYRHALEITVQGSYADMVAYLQELERLPRRLYWGNLKLDAERYPSSVMTVTVYTISTEKAWLVL